MAVMDKMMAYCGLDCDSCPIHLATMEQDKSLQHTMRISIAQYCSEHYEMNLQPEDINDCDGCRSDTGNLFDGCRRCEVRKCAGGRDLESCGYCDDYACDNLNRLFVYDPGAKIRLDEIRNAAG
jgi:hypothetical protein